MGAQQLRLRFEFRADGSATLVSIDQGGVEIPASILSLTAEKIEIDVPAVAGGFKGRLAAPDRIEGVWRQGSELPLVLVRGEARLAPAKLAPAVPLTQENLKKLREAAGAPALAAARDLRGKRTFWVDGVRQLGASEAATTKDQWHLGSITKSMTATLVARLVEAGAVRWDDSVGAVLGETAPQMLDAYKSVTFRHLLCHRAGLPGNIPMADFAKFPRESDDPREQRKDFIRIALSMAPRGPKEATFEYANNGYVIAGAMLEQKLGASWETLIRQHVFTPLKLASAGFGAPGKTGEISQPVGHARLPDGVLKPFPLGGGVTDNPAVLGPAGRVHMALEDVLTYLAAHRDQTKLLKPESWRTLHTPPFGGNYAMGWMVRPDGTLWHNGSNTLWYAEILFDPKRGIAAATACNDGEQAKVAPQVGAALLAAAA